MKITISSGTVHFVFRIPTAFLLGSITENILYHILRKTRTNQTSFCKSSTSNNIISCFKESNIQVITKYQIHAIFKELRHAKKIYKGLTIVDICSASNEKVQISL